MSLRQLRNVNAERFDFLAGVLPHGINPTDIDLSFERRGHFLFLEGKRPGQKITRGQTLYFDALKAGPRSITVVRFEGTPPDRINGYAQWGQPLIQANADGLRDFVRAWFDWVEARAAA